jgi:outer membrane protein assembly factor BamB
LGGRVYVGAADKHFYVLGAEKGDYKWGRRVGAAPRGRAAIDEDNIYFVALDNVLWALDRGHGAVKWRKGFKYRPAEGPSIIRGGIVVPGAVPTLSVFGPEGSQLNDLTFPAAVLGISNVPGGESPTLLSAVTGDLEHPWTLWLLEPSSDPPPIPLADLTVVPGVAIDIVLPQ